MGYLSKILNLVWKDLVIEFRAKEILSVMLIFAILVPIILAFSLNSAQETTENIFPGIIWVALTFSGILGFNRTFLNEKQNDSLLGLMLTPVDRTAIYFAKVIVNFTMMIFTEAVTLPLLFILFDFRFRGSILTLVLVIFLGTLGFTSVSTFLSALSANTRASEILLPIILFPIIIPVIIAAVQSTGIVLVGASIGEIASWIKLLGVYDVIFMAVPFILFEYILEV
ncbi:MAG: heme exporter protein [Clostridia bacterium]|nr:ABC-type transport system involved in cytochrome c biosis, permease component [Clostridiales bacterium]MDK2986328.1 heme exporter protein [Clostridia bacterium]